MATSKTGTSKTTRTSSKSSTPSAKSSTKSGTRSSAKSSSSTSAKSRVTQSKSAMERFKTEVASELGVNLKAGGELTARQAGQIGGEMVRRMIKKQADQMK